MKTPSKKSRFQSYVSHSKIENVKYFIQEYDMENSKESAR